MTVVVIGAKELDKKFRLLGRYGPKAVARGAYEAAETIMTDAKGRTPVDTGALRASGFVKETMGSAWGIADPTFELGFGGPSASYAAIVHERGPRKGGFHETGDNTRSGAVLYESGGVGERKFLENAIRANEQNVVKIIGKHLDREIKRRGVA